MNPLDDLARTDIDPALLARVQALFAQQQAKLGREGLQDHSADARTGLLPPDPLWQGQRGARR